MTGEKPARPGTIFRKVTAKGWRPRHVAEVGVGEPEASNVVDFLAEGIRCTLVEPDPGSVRKLLRAFGEARNVRIHPVAVLDRRGTVAMYRRGPSTFVGEVRAPPAVVNDGYEPAEADRFEVEAVPFDAIDDGSIDLLCVDVEGSEWAVLERSVSRPAVISVETHGAAYRNPNLDRIERWMRDHGYVPWYRDRSDTVYVRPDVVPVSAVDRIVLLWTDLRLALRRARKRLGKRMRG